MKKRINNERFSISFCKVAEQYGHKTIGSFKKALEKAKPSTKWCYNTTYIRGTKLLAEINAFID